MTTPINSAASTLMSSMVRPSTSTAGKSTVYNDLSSLAHLKMESHQDPQQAIKEVSKQFESLFVTMMMKAMRDTVPKDGMFDSAAMQSYQDMSDQQMALDFSRNGSLGLAKVIEKQLSKTIVPRGE